MREVIAEFLEYIDDIKKVLVSIHFDLILEVLVNLIVLGILFKLINFLV